MQKQHTKNMQELLDETNARLQRMEEEYTEQISQTVRTTFYTPGHTKSEV